MTKLFYKQPFYPVTLVSV